MRLISQESSLEYFDRSAGLRVRGRRWTRQRPRDSRNLARLEIAEETPGMRHRWFAYRTGCRCALLGIGVMLLAAVSARETPPRGSAVTIRSSDPRLWVTTTGGQELKGSVVSSSPTSVTLRRGSRHDYVADDGGARNRSSRFAHQWRAQSVPSSEEESAPGSASRSESRLRWPCGNCGALYTEGAARPWRRGRRARRNGR